MPSLDSLIPILEALPWPTWWAGPDKQWSYFNQAWLALASRELERECREGWLDHVYDADRDRFLFQYFQAVEQQQSFNCRVRMQFPGQAVRWYLCDAHPQFDAHQVCVGYVGCLIALGAGEAESHALSDSQCERAEQTLERQNRELEVLLHIASHDLKEPLRAIKDFSAILESDCFEQLSAVYRDYLKRINHAADRMHQLLDELLRLARARQLQIPAHAQPARPIVEEALQRLQARIYQTHAEIHVDEVLPDLWADRTWAVQAVYNLLSNALKFTVPHEVPRIEVQGCAFEHDGYRETGLVVCDRGPGVAAGYRTKIFELFKRAVGREVEGVGAGLAIVKAVAERHQGRAWCQPRTGGGSEFYVTFRQRGAGNPSSR